MNYALSVLPGTFEITHSVTPPAIGDPATPPVLIDPSKPPVVMPPKLPVVTEPTLPLVNVFLEEAKEIISSISEAEKVTHPNEQPAMSAKMAQATFSAITV